VLVQVLACADPEEEASRHHRGARRRRLGDDRGMDPDQRARDAGSEPQLFGLARDPANHAPDERALTLAVDPWMEVIRDQSEGEARLLRRARVLDQAAGSVLLARERIAELDHARLVPRRIAAETVNGRLTELNNELSATWL
jgi:hypothetical protein